MTAKTFVFRLSQRLRSVRHWLLARLAFGLLRLLRILPMDSALNFADRAARRIGPLSGRHRVAVDNLRRAYPERTDDEIEAIALNMWGNMARLGAEYIYLDRMFDYDPKALTPGRVEVSGIHLFEKIAGEKRPHILFTAHLGNFELLPIAGAAYGMQVTSLFRPPNNPYIADYILSARRSSMGNLMASRSGASFALARLLEADGTIGVLVDQKFNNGLPTSFFGRDCETSPLLPKLARQFECDVYPARCIRLPGNRFRLEIEDKVDLPRAADGRIDLRGSAQMLNDIVERWVREDPGQWMWFHKRWKRSKGRKGRKPVVSLDAPGAS